MSTSTRTPAIIEEAALRTLAADGVVPIAAIAAWRMLVDDSADASTSDATAPLARADIVFHRAVVEAQRSPRLARLHALLMGEIELCTGQVLARRRDRARSRAAAT